MARILQVCNTDFYLEHFLAPLVRALTEAGHEVHCVCEGRRLSPLALGPSVVLHDLPFPREGSPWQFARSIQGLRRILRQNRFDLVDSHNRNASIAARVAAFVERVPVNLYTAHGFYFHDDQRPLAREATLRLEALLSHVTDYTLSQSQEDVTEAVRRHVLPAERITWIGNGIDTTRFSPGGNREEIEARLGLKSARFRIAATGRIVQGKGFTDLLRAFAWLHKRVPRAELLMIGGNIRQDISPYQETFLRITREEGLSDAVVVTGLTDAVRDYLATADVFVLPSYREGMPRALLEAMSMQLPVVATDIRGCREIITHGQHGYLFPPHGVDALGFLLLSLHEEPSTRLRMGEEARARAVAHFDEKHYVKIQVQQIETLLREAATSRKT